MVDWKKKKKGESISEEDLGTGNLFATGLVAGGALAGVAVALLIAGSDSIARSLQTVNLEAFLEKTFTPGIYQFAGVIAFLLLGLLLYRIALKKQPDGLG